MITVYVFSNRVHDKLKAQAQKAKAKAAVEKNPLVQFYYPRHQEPWDKRLRTVRLIGANGKYFIGLEVSDNNRFKKFLRTKATGLTLLEFSPESVS